jgi:hypothetical protein
MLDAARPPNDQTAGILKIPAPMKGLTRAITDPKVPVFLPDAVTTPIFKPMMKWIKESNQQSRIEGVQVIQAGGDRHPSALKTNISRDMLVG